MQNDLHGNAISSRRRRQFLRTGMPLLALIAISLVVGFPRQGMMLPLAQAQSPTKRPVMPNFTFPILDGKKWTLSQHRGQVILLNFWATWCPPCRAETPDMVKLSDQYRARGLDVVGINMDDSNLDNVRSFVAAYHIPYPILLPNPGSPVVTPIQAYPTTVLIDRQGRIASAYEGELDIAAVRPELMKLLEEPDVTPHQSAAKGKTRVASLDHSANQ